MLGIDEEQGVEGRAIHWPCGHGWGQPAGLDGATCQVRGQVAWPLDLGTQPQLRTPLPMPTFHIRAPGDNVLSLAPTCPSTFLVPHQGLLESKGLLRRGGAGVA